MAVDSNIGSLPAAASIEDDSLLVAEQQGEAKHFTGKQLKDYAKKGVDALVAAAQKAADDAEQAARDAKAAADSVQDVSADAAAAKAAAQAATQAVVAADNARLAAEAAASLAAGDAAANVENRLKQYVSDAQSAKNAAEQAAENAAAEAVQQVESQLEDYVSDAEQAKEDAQSAAGTAAQDAVSAANAQLADYVSSAQAAQKAAEQARNEAQAIAGGNFLPTAGGIMTGPITLTGDPTEDLHAVPKRYVDDTLGYVENELSEVNGGTEGEDDTGSGDGTGGMTYQIGHGLKVEDNTLMVNSVLDFEGDNSLPAAASLVQSTVGNIEILLATI